MAKRKPEEPKAGAAWLNTFADLMNLLLCFFVLLFSMSTIDAQKFEAIAASLSDSFSIFSGGATALGEGILISNGVSQLNELDQYLNSMGKAAEESIHDDIMGENKGSENDTDASADIEQAVAEELEQREEKQLQQSEEMAEIIQEILTEQNLDQAVDIDFTSQYVQLTLNGALLFDSGSAQIKPDALPILDKIGVILQKYSDEEIEIEGHTDNVPISGRFANNNELSSARALSVFEYLMDHTTLDPARVKHTGRGEYIPVADNSTPEGRAQNRRVEIKIYHTIDNQ
ncbi:MAG: flagellar motor protein MotB [Lachnospiraceae bacterium]|nr:flagellar motor protein MotB [Lachnospiraceae bacterium]